MRLAYLAIALVTSPALAAGAEDAPFQGEWRTSLGVVRFEQKGDKLTTKFENPQIPALKGDAKGKTATLSYTEGNLSGEATVTVDDAGRSFSGWFQYKGGPRQPWNGWRPDPQAPKDKTGDFRGLWLTSFGLMDLEQDKAKVRGKYASRGTSGIEGTAAGRTLEFRYKWFREGKGWFDLVDDGKNLAGAALGDGANSWYGWSGRRAPEFARHAKLVAGKTVDGSTKGLLTYSVHAPEGYKAGDGKTWPTIVILHGSNMNGKSYVETIASAWPDVARDFIVLGLNGEIPSDTGPDPRFNFSYVNYVGKSTFGGFPGTDRESPALVAEALTELKSVYPVKHYVVGGHSQGAFLTYSILMNTPELIAGAFPISGGVIFQCEPDAYDNEALRKAQRKIPLAIVHGKTDPAVNFSMGRYAATLFGESNWPALRFFTDDTAGHMFARLPVNQAIRWIETLNSDDPETLVSFAETSLKEKRFRDTVAALSRLHMLKPSATEAPRIDKVARAVNEKATVGARKHLPKIRANADGSWVDAFLAYRDDFEFADAAREPMEAFAKLRAQHKKPAQDAFNQARQAFQQGMQDNGYAKYQEIVDKYYASPLYPTVKTWVEERKAAKK